MNTIKSSIEISELFAHGKRVHTPYFTLIVLPTEHDRTDNSGGRVAFMAGKRLGNAVWRNAAKRRMRAVCHEAGGPFPGYDVVFLAKGKISRDSYGEVLSSGVSAFSKIPSLFQNEDK